MVVIERKWSILLSIIIDFLESLLRSGKQLNEDVMPFLIGVNTCLIKNGKFTKKHTPIKRQYFVLQNNIVPDLSKRS